MYQLQRLACAAITLPLLRPISTMTTTNITNSTNTSNNTNSNTNTEMHANSNPSSSSLATLVPRRKESDKEHLVFMTTLPLSSEQMEIQSEQQQQQQQKRQSSELPELLSSWEESSSSLSSSSLQKPEQTTNGLHSNVDNSMSSKRPMKEMKSTSNDSKPNYTSSLNGKLVEPFTHKLENTEQQWESNSSDAIEFDIDSVEDINNHLFHSSIDGVSITTNERENIKFKVQPPNVDMDDCIDNANTIERRNMQHKEDKAEHVLFSQEQSYNQKQEQEQEEEEEEDVKSIDLLNNNGIVFTETPLDEEESHTTEMYNVRSNRQRWANTKKRKKSRLHHDDCNIEEQEQEEEEVLEKERKEEEELQSEEVQELENEEEEEEVEREANSVGTQYELSVLKTDKEVHAAKQEALIAELYDKDNNDNNNNNTTSNISALPNLDNDGADSLGFDLNAAHSYDSTIANDQLNVNQTSGVHETFTEGDTESKNVNENLLSVIDMLCDDLFYCKRDVLINFARTRGLTCLSKAEIVFRLISIAHDEAHGESKDLTATKRLLGDVFNEDVRTSGLRSAWTNKSLEASHIEQACARHLGFESMTNIFITVMVRRNVAEATRVLRRLSRPFQSEYGKIANSAVNGMYRSYKAEADELVRTHSVAEIVSPFASFLVSFIRYGASVNLITRINVNEKLMKLGLITPDVEDEEFVNYNPVPNSSSSLSATREDKSESHQSLSSIMSNEEDENSNISSSNNDNNNNNVSKGTSTQNEFSNTTNNNNNMGMTSQTIVSPTLQQLMSLLDDVTAEVEQVRGESAQVKSRTTIDQADHVAFRVIRFAGVAHSHWNTEAAPHWVHELARMFNNWEAIVRNDIPTLNDVPRHFFDAILIGVVNCYVLQKVYEDIFNNLDVVMTLRNMPRHILVEHFNGDQEKARHTLRELVTYVQTIAYESKSIIRPDFFAAVLSQMQGATGEAEHDVLHSERVAVILKESTYIASRCSRSAGLEHLLSLITGSLHFHFRFLKVFKKMNAIDRTTIRTRISLNMTKTINYFEKEFHITPPSIKSIAFLTIVLMYLAMRSGSNKSASPLLQSSTRQHNNNSNSNRITHQDGRQPIVQRFASVLQRPELSIVGLTDPGFTKVRDLHIAFPPQLSYNSWLNESDTREKSIYNVLPSVAVKGATNQAMLISQAPMMKALDAISRVPWRINKYMLHVQEAMVREGFEFGKIRPGFYPLHFTELSAGDVVFPARKSAASCNNTLHHTITSNNNNESENNNTNNKSKNSNSSSSKVSNTNDEVTSDNLTSAKSSVELNHEPSSEEEQEESEQMLSLPEENQIDYSEDRKHFSNGAIRHRSKGDNDLSFDLGNEVVENDGGQLEQEQEEQQEPLFNMREKWEYTKQLRADWKSLSEVRSSRIHYLQALRQARSIVQFSHLYFPNSMDFRGRMYPLPGRLNHTGSDPFRALLEYAEPKPLGKVGLYWLKVHLANKFGMSKMSFDERVHFVDEHVEDVIHSAESPLHGDRWWQEASEPLQCLMACKELADAFKCSQGSENFMSRLPVAVDGSYNGLQHYSAIGRDELGAALVNLVPSERPADAYTGILKEMMKFIEADAARDHQVAQRCIGTGKGQDKNHIKRKTIKRPIMTQVYGVTAYGMTEQIKDQLEKQNKTHGLWTSTDITEMAAYIRDKLLESLGITFKETQNCRKWIRTVSSLVWEVQPPELRNALCWTTPLGLVVRQPYRQHRELPLFCPEGFTKITGDAVAPASKKQLTAIAPNLIHSLDATHLAMTALEMQHRGLSMMAVHDSYWTYACDLPALSQILREQFVALYSKYDPLWELKEQWEEAYFMDLRRHGVRLPDPPQRGKLDITTVLNSQYFFS